MATRTDRQLRADGYARIMQLGDSIWYASPRYPGWDHPALIRNAQCADGRRRTVYLGNDADSYFSWPGRAWIGGRWVTGFVTTEESSDGMTDTRFTAYTVATVEE